MKVKRLVELLLDEDQEKDVFFSDTGREVTNVWKNEGYPEIFID